MRSKLLNADPPVTYAVVLGTDDEVVSELGEFVREQEVEAASLTPINRVPVSGRRWRSNARLARMPSGVCSGGRPEARSLGRVEQDGASVLRVLASADRGPDRIATEASAIAGELCRAR
jgi:hypothetical protein